MTGVKRTISAIVILSVSLFALDCGQDQNEKINGEKMREKAKSELVNTDIQFFNFAQENGTGRAFIEFADTEAVMLRQDNFPVSGKSAIMELFKGRESKVTPLKWQPVKADVSEDGTMGFTYGNWQYAVKNEKGKIQTTYGNYVTVWKKQDDGKWKYILDGGNTTPPPSEKN